MKKIIFALMAMAYCMNSAASGKIKTSQDSISYALGYVIGGQQVSKALLEKYGCNKELFIKALTDALNGDSSTMTQVKANAIMRSADQKIEDSEDNKKNQAYFEAKIKNDQYMAGVKADSRFAEIPNSWDSTATGVYRRVITEGDGETPTASSAVKFNYKYKLTNGKVVSESKSGEPIEGLINTLLPGLQDALVQMPVGSKWEIVIPSELAFDKDEQYNSDGSVMVPANSILIFELELINTGTPEEIDFFGGE